MAFRNMNNDNWETSPLARNASFASACCLANLVLDPSCINASFRTPGEVDAWQSRIVAGSRIPAIIAVCRCLQERVMSRKP
jgi:hypothetical protein